MTYVFNQFHKIIKAVRTDNDTEFVNHNFDSFLSQCGILHHKSCAYTPQQNARVERKHRHLLEIARSLRFQSGLPFKYWGESILTATHIVNILTTLVLKNKTPYELLYKTKPDYTMLKPFGCLSYASFHSADKFDPRAIKCVFLGYPHLTKGYKLLRLDTHAIIISRHVKFVETEFPYHQLTHSVVQFTTTTSTYSYDFLTWLKSNDSTTTSLSENIVDQNNNIDSGSSANSGTSAISPISSTFPESSVVPETDHLPLIRRSNRDKVRPLW